MVKDEMGDRFKAYESIPKNFLIRRVPVIIRLDGNAFHTFTKGLERPFDEKFIQLMQETAEFLFKKIQGCKLAFVQSDEISLLLTDYEKITTDAWFGYNVQKITSISASMATLFFNKRFKELFPNQIKKFDEAMFDSRCMNMPKEEVCNYFLWRQQDCTRNSIQSVGQANFSHKQLNGLSCNKIKEKLLSEKDICWEQLETFKKRGTCIIRNQNGVNIDLDIPIFSQDRIYIESLL